MNKIKKFLKEEKAAAQMIEAAIIYPIVFLTIFLMIYMGLYILQSITVGTYAQKVAMLASREISTPGYYTLISKQEKYSSSAIELDATADEINSLVDTGSLANEMTSFPVVYRYWQIGNDKILTSTTKDYYQSILKTMVSENSIFVPQNDGALKVKISCKNNVISQLVTVEVEQELMHFAVLDFFGIESPTVSATAVATVSDTDELIRNTDFAVDAMGALASKLGIDISKISGKVNEVLKKLKLID